MALTDVRAYFRTRMVALNFKEWPDGFNFENIPKSIINNAFHIESNTITPDAVNMTTYDFSSPVTLRLFVKGFRDPAQAIDNAITFYESILCEVLKPANRLGTQIQNVTPGPTSILPLSDNNDNAVILEMEFTARVFLNVI